MKLKPHFARVLLYREKAEKVGSIMLPPSAQKRHASLKCKVLAKGPAADESIKIGSWVIVGKHAGAWIRADGMAANTDDEAEFYVVNDEDIIAEVENG